MFKFSDFTLRPATAEDHNEIARSIACDSDHRGQVQPEFFYQPEPGEECFALCDATGEVIFYFKQERALRLHIQFRYAETVEQRERNRRGLKEGFAWLAQMGWRAGFRQLIFESSTAALIRFCEKRLGFRRSEHELVRGIAPEKASEVSKLEQVAAGAGMQAPEPELTRCVR